LLLSGNHFLLLTQGVLVEEQISPLEADPTILAQTLLEARRPTVDVTRECVLLARFGEDVWGHWLLELLPRAVAAEAAYPGRFTFAVPKHTTQPFGEERSFARSVLESLAAYGISSERLLRLDIDRNYRFRSLYLIEAAWSARIPHPQMLDLMREAICQPVPAGPGARIALLRADATTRSVFNAAQLVDQLTDEGFRMTEMGHLTFIEQVAAWRDADTVFGVLGSGMAGLVYARDAVRLITAAPANWCDFYFCPLIQMRRGINAEIRAPSLWTGEGLLRDAPLVIDPRNVVKAIAAVAMDLAILAPDGMMRPAGVELPRWLGPCVLDVDFSENGNAGKYLGAGWSFQETYHVWSLGVESTLTVPMPTPRDDYMLELQVVAFTVPPYLPLRRLIVTVNGVTIGDHQIGEPVTIGIRLPRACLEGFNRLAFTFATPICPPARVIGAGSDTRELGIGMLSLRIRTQPRSPALQ
jgi:hypothetical protein